MFGSLPRRWRLLTSSLAYSALVGVVAGLGYLTYQAINEHRHPPEAAGAGEPAPAPLVELSGFSARRERSADMERLTVSVRLRLTAPGTVDGYVYVVARNDQTVPRQWGVWPTQGPGGALTAGGHFQTTTPTTGEPVHLTTGWSRIYANISHAIGQPPYDRVIVYVVSPNGGVLLSRPFALS